MGKNTHRDSKGRTVVSRRRFLEETAVGCLGLSAGVLQAGYCGEEIDKPSLVVILSDQQHGRALGFLDPFFETPNLDAMAKESVVFDQAFCSCPQCSPSRSSLMTGLYPHKTGVLSNIGAAMGDVQELHQETIGTILQDLGYYTGYFGKWHLGNDKVGCSGWNERRIGIKDPEVSQEAQRFLSAMSEKKKPFALFLSYVNPHDIYSFKPGNHSPLQNRSIPLPESWENPAWETKPRVQKQFMTEDQGKILWGHEKEDWQAYRDYYRSKVQLFDREVGKVLQTLRTQDCIDETIIIVSSDHGDMDTANRLIFKGPFMYENLVRVPLLVRIPPRLRGGIPERVEQLISNVDLVPTLSELAGGTDRGSDGTSFAGFLLGQGDLPRREFIIGEYYAKQRWINPIRMLRTQQWKYNRYRVHGEELYDLKNDPEEMVNLAEDPGYRKIKQELSNLLDSWMKENNDFFNSYGISTRDGHRILAGVSGEPKPG